MTTDETSCPDGCGEMPLDGYIYAGATPKDRERHRSTANRARGTVKRAGATQMVQARSVLEDRGIDLEAGGEVLADSLRRDAEAVWAMATVVAAAVRESGVDALTEMRAKQALVVRGLTGEREEAMGHLREAERRRVALSAQLEAAEDELAAARVEAGVRLGCEEELRVAVAAAGDEGARLAAELQRVQAEAAGLASELAAVTATRDASVADREDLVRRHEQVADRARHTQEEVVALRTELGRVATTIAAELATAATVATAERAAAVREAQAESRREITDLRAQVTRLTHDQSHGGLAPGLIVVRR